MQFCPGRWGRKMKPYRFLMIFYIEGCSMLLVISSFAQINSHLFTLAWAPARNFLFTISSYTCFVLPCKMKRVKGLPTPTWSTGLANIISVSIAMTQMEEIWPALELVFNPLLQMPCYSCTARSAGGGFQQEVRWQSSEAPSKGHLRPPPDPMRWKVPYNCSRFLSARLKEGQLVL